MTVSDVLPPGMRLRADTVRIDGVRVTANVAANGREFSVVVPSIGRAPNGKVDYKASRERALAALGVGA